MPNLKDYGFSPKDCKFLVSFCRKVILHYFKTGEKIEFDYVSNPQFQQKMGIFVTIKTYPDSELRGCIGFPKPIISLGDALIENALNAAFNDPRFPPLVESELDHVIFEVSVLTPPEEIIVENPKDYLKTIKIGKDGLIIKYGSVSGLLLPQVPVEYNWNVTQFLEALCEKAGLPKHMWANLTVQIFTFNALVYGEDQPGGKVNKVKLII